MSKLLFANVVHVVKSNFDLFNNVIHWSKQLGLTNGFQLTTIDLRTFTFKRKNRSNFTVNDEYRPSRFIFCLPMPESAIGSRFSLLGMPDYVHSDRGSAFTSYKCEQFFLNGEWPLVIPLHTILETVPRWKGTIVSCGELALHSHGLQSEDGELVLPDVLHSLRS